MTRPYNILQKTKERVAKTFYYYKGEVRWWDGKQLRNKEQEREQKKEYHKTHKKERKEYYKTHKEHIKEYNKKYSKTHKEEINKRLRDRYKNEPNYRMSFVLRARFRQALKSQKTKKTTSVFKLTSCSIAFLRDYLSDQFEEGMTWKNQGEWHIDHRKPCARFNFVNDEEQLKCFHYTNLQPLWGPENMGKSDTFDEATFEYSWIEGEGWVKF
jgi:hypothetical protein